MPRLIDAVLRNAQFNEHVNRCSVWRDESWSYISRATAKGSMRHKCASPRMCGDVSSLKDKGSFRHNGRKVEFSDVEHHYHFR